MKTRTFSLTVFMIFSLACSQAAPSDDGEGLAMCAPGVTDCVDLVIEDGETGEEAEPTGNALDPTPITEGEFLGAEGNEVRVRVWTGVEPCDTLHSVEVTETADSVDLEVLHGAIDPAAICPAIAMERIIVAELQAPLGDRTLTLSGVELA
ncbi:MAG TPA: hypothetical protein VJQ57_08905 [Acidimicrobiia bacterium]|nr:hypothetical protein [Acidimicrobiia bacterium]